MKLHALITAVAVGIVACSVPAPPAPAAKCPPLPEPPSSPTRAYTLLIIEMYKMCAIRP